MNPLRLSTLAVLVALAGLTGTAAALPGDQDQPMTITADHGSLRQGSGEATFTGDVYVKQGSLELWADTLDVVRNTETGEITFMEAHGEPARYQFQPDEDSELVKVRGARIEYRPQDDIIITEGDGDLEQANNQVEAGYIRYNLATEALDVRSERVETENPEGDQATWVLQPETVSE